MGRVWKGVRAGGPEWKGPMELRGGPRPGAQGVKPLAGWVGWVGDSAGASALERFGESETVSTIFPKNERLWKCWRAARSQEGLQESRSCRIFALGHLHAPRGCGRLVTQTGDCPVLPWPAPGSWPPGSLLASQTDVCWVTCSLGPGLEPPLLPSRSFREAQPIRGQEILGH